jgi:opacity protein-like surface antigen
MKRLIVIAATILVASSARSAAAQTFINPFVGTTLTSPTASGGSSKPGFGAAFGIGKIIGGETEFAYYPELLNNADNGLAKSKVISYSAGTLIGPTLGRVKPYGAIGVGGLYLNVTSLASLVIPNPASFSSNYFSVNAGGGVMVFFSNHVGLRGDLRYTKAYGFNLADLQTTGLALDGFDFWRAGIGLAF